MTTTSIPLGRDGGPGSESRAAFERAYSSLRQEKRRTTILVSVLFALSFLGAAWIGNFNPVTIVTGIPRLHEFVVKTLPDLAWDTLWADLEDWLWLFNVWMGLLVETVLIAFLATVFGIVGAFSLCFAASRNLTSNGWVVFVTRRFFEICRSVPELVYALIFVFCFGVGPMAGVLAIAVHTTGALGKLYSEVNENVDANAMEGVRASGGNWFQTIRYAVVPQVLPNFVSYTLLRFEINVRSSSIIGYVGAGGLGQEIRTALGFGEYQDLSALFLIIFVTVAVIDLISEKVRHRFIGKEGLV